MPGWARGVAVDAARRTLVEEGRPAEASVPRAAIRVQDPDLRPATRRPEAAAGHLDLGPLSDDVVAEPDPGPTLELQAEPEAGIQRPVGPASRRLEDDEQGTGPPGERGEAAEGVDEPGRPAEPGRQVEEEQVDGPALEERARHRERLLDRGRCHDHEPLEPDAAGDRLDRVEGALEVDVRHDRARGLGLRDEPQREGGPAARGVATQREASGPRDAPGSEDGVELGEPCRHDRGERGAEGSRGRALLGEGGLRNERPGDPRRLERLLVRLGRQRHRGQRSDDLPEGLPAGPERGRAPSLTEGRECGVDGSGGGHRTTRIERMF